MTGIISVDNLLSGRPIGPADAAPLCALANHVGTAIANARLRERERAEHARLAVAATTDALTGLPNRRLFHDRLDHALRAARRDHTAVALLLIDMDRFKAVNDTWGHHVGDLLLQEVSARLQGATRQSDTVARLGGDEFAMLLPATDAVGAARVAQEALTLFDAAFLLDGHALHVGASVGVAVYPDHGAEAPTLLRHADATMYAHKHSRGRPS